MAEKLSNQRQSTSFSSPPITTWQTTSLLPPVAEVESTTKHPDLLFPSLIKKDDLNDEFDEIQLLNLINSKNKSKAKHLLEEFDKRGNELTWNSSGVLFIDQDAVPNTNFFILFPLLFKRFTKNKVPGLSELILKINQMGLGDFISHKNPKKSITKLSEDFNLDKESNIPWWYIGN